MPNIECIFPHEPDEQELLSGQEYIDHLARGEIPPLPISGTGVRRGTCHGVEQFMARNIITSKFNCWPIIDNRWTKQLSDWIGDRSVLEIMAGSGWLTKALHNHGAKVYPTDANSHNKVFQRAMPVKQLGAIKSVKKYCSQVDVLLVSWPYMDDVLVNALQHWDSNKPIIYIGEKKGGCTASDAFFNGFQPTNEGNKIQMHRYTRINDSVQIGYFNK